MYSVCSKHNIPHRNTGKWIVAQNEQQMNELQKIHESCKAIGVPTEFLARSEISSGEPDVRAEAGVLSSPSTGIVDSHSLMTYLEGAFLDHGGDLAVSTTVTSIEPLSSSTSGSLPGSSGWSITTVATDDASSPTTITAQNLINSAGLHAIPLSNSILPPSRHITPHYAKGTYYSYSGRLPHPPTTLIYPAPVPGLGGLGTHLTLDISGAIRFGPDVEWLPPTYPTSATNYTPNPDPNRKIKAISLIKEYLPCIDPSLIETSYCGIRPKLKGQGQEGKTGKGAGGDKEDFYIKREDGFEGWVNLLGIESPGLTSCLAIGEEVERLVYGDGDGEGLTNVKGF
ncbi:putative fad dependent [Phaeomoniella chlamydospora]|uniref:L-2-hydroxyglutarate dehydrogenase, mitochondrial n=1 Tax=Phaeomoniella chlamydospora TaxID=158046 RepID=A0A0G2GB42_PHACM|nr:putative fad dependent [Phaeomoniella chlamydospora]